MIHAELDRLQSCLNFALDTLRKEMDSSQLPPLSQYNSVEHPLDDPTTYLPSTALFEARRLSLGESTLYSVPLDKRMDERLAAYVAVCTDTLIKTGIIDYLSDVPNPSRGVSAAELASKFELDSQKLVPILRCYAANGWARETCDSSFALNRCSRTFIKGHPGWRLGLPTPGFMTMVEAVPHWATESDWKLSRSPTQTAFQIAFKTPLHRFSWIMQNQGTVISVSDHIQVIGDMSTPSIVADYPWEQLETSVIVDCGGGMGGLVSAILDAHPSFRAVVQDTEGIVSLTEERRPRHVESGILKVEVHDFFQPQRRIGNEYSFILRHIMHNWPDKEAASVARPIFISSKILIIDIVAVPNADSTSTKSFLLDSHANDLDYSIPSHFGSASEQVSAVSVHMLTLMNGCERSLHEWKTLVKGCGLRITNVYSLRAHPSIIECALDT
ncbi:S-adenosyl-L-methionine-dependent methyltransferase [Suillus subalutaceus]|uniref:S-adenosyl-L-methionine-dependent methyltransferase n=1 Tax=Suillus subalutaceus TaxID=48586 RepID=UPI001B8740B4|nr:S-adenosyl-L-methionine-dependent methyltransferase [Suillus subalutaceus]KAG1863570.1 S-adenosyl-L-methionine-dependent methyltransferase [Suillus subalutaceus]